MAKRVSLREFQQDLSRRLANSRIDGRHQAVLAVQAGNENWLVDLADAGEILPPPPISDVPLTRPWFRGITNIRGNLYSVIDFTAFMGEAPIILTNEARLLLIGTKHGLNSALLVSRALGLRNPEDFDASDANPPLHPWIGGTYRDNQGRLWKRLQARHLATDSRFLDASTDRHL